MSVRRIGRAAAAVVLRGVLVAVAVGMSTAGATERCAIWIDLYTGEPAGYERMLEDLATVDVVYLGEKHTLERHHRLQERILADLAAQGPAVLGLEQLNRAQQPGIDRFNAGEIDFDELAEEIEWSENWPRYQNYRSLVERARELGVPVIGLNAELTNVRAVARKGLDGVSDEVRSVLPETIDLDDPMYRKHMKTVMSVHAHAAAHPGMIDSMFQAQVVRDETMASALVDYLSSEEGKGRRAIVVTGSGHVEHAMGVPSRVRRMMPEAEDRIIVMSDSGDVELSPMEKKAVNEDFELTHSDLRHLQRPLGDYLHVVEAKPEPEDESADGGPASKEKREQE